MRILTYKQTVSIEIRFDPDEEQIIEETRRSALGQYWQADSLDTDNLSLSEIEMLYETLGCATGHTETPVNIFKPTGGEAPVDVPGNGELAEPAEELYQNLLDLLLQWNHDVTVHDSGISSRSPDE